MEGDAALFQILDHLERVESWCVVVRHIPPISEQNREKLQLYWPLRDVQAAPPHRKR